MAKSNAKAMRDAVREEYVQKFIDMLMEQGEDVQKSKSNEFAFPVCDAEGGEHWLKITVSVPTGSRDEDGYDGYGLAEAYQMKLMEKAAKAKEKEAKPE